MSNQKVLLYAPSRHTMQMGRRKTKQWVMEFEASRTQLRQHLVDPLMNWPQTSDTKNQLILYFNSRAEALNYATTCCLDVREIDTQQSIIKPKSYATNFAVDRRR